jgi:osmotically-inducible protein OsmY
MTCDAEILQFVEAQFLQSDDPELRSIEITVSECLVTLRGIVSGHHKRLQARDDTARLIGDARIVDELAVNVPQDQVRPDDDITRELGNALRQRLPHSCNWIRPSVAAGTVALEGLEWDYQWSRVENAMKTIPGIAGVRKSLRPDISPVLPYLRDAWQRSKTASSQVPCSTSGPSTRGAVFSWAERQKAHERA